MTSRDDQALAELGGQRASRSESSDSHGTAGTMPRLAKWYTYIANEVRSALGVPWQRFWVHVLYRRLVLLVLAKLPDDWFPQLRERLRRSQNPVGLQQVPSTSRP